MVLLDWLSRGAKVNALPLADFRTYFIEGKTAGSISPYHMLEAFFLAEIQSHVKFG